MDQLQLQGAPFNRVHVSFRLSERSVKRQGYGKRQQIGHRRHCDSAVAYDPECRQDADSDAQEEEARQMREVRGDAAEYCQKAIQHAARSPEVEPGGERQKEKSDARYAIDKPVQEQIIVEEIGRGNREPVLRAMDYPRHRMASNRK